MPNPTELKRLDAAAALQAAIAQQIMNPQRLDLPAELVQAVDAIADYSIAFGIDQLTAIASAMIFKHATDHADVPESETPSAPG